MNDAERSSRERHPAGKHGKANFEEARKYLWSIGKCGSVSDKGHLCTLTANHRPRQHEAQVMGGVEDGKLIAEWPW